MAFIEFVADLSRTTSVLELISSELRLIREALERLSPVIESKPEPHQASLSDLRSTDPRSVVRITAALEEYAQEHEVALHSEAFISSVVRFEQEVAEVYGEQAVDELPWNKAAGGRLFEAEAREGYPGRARAADEKPARAESRDREREAAQEAGH